MSYYCFFPVRNGEDTLRQTLDSLFAQKLQPSKVVVVDDGSTDSTPDILTKYDVQVIRLPSQKTDFARIPMLWNLCLHAGYSDYHMMLADDICLSKGYAASLVMQMERNRKLVITSGNFPASKKASAPQGAGRLVQEQFFVEICGGKYPNRIGAESWILHQALRYGYDIKNFSDVEMIHLQALGRNHNFNHWGVVMKALGYPTTHALLRTMNNLVWQKEMPRGAAIRVLAKFLFIKLEPNGYYSYFDKEFRDYVRSASQQHIRKTVLRKLANVLLGDTLKPIPRVETSWRYRALVKGRRVLERTGVIV